MTVCYWCGAKDTLADIGKELDDGKYKMVQCSKCKNAYYVVNKEKMNKPKQMTNEEWIKSLDTEQLAKRLHNNDVYAFFVCRNGGKVPSVEHYVEWLKQPHTKE